eukprot:s1021_g4.t1
MSSSESPTTDSGELSGESDISMVHQSQPVFQREEATFQANVLRRIAWNSLGDHLDCMLSDRGVIGNKWRSVQRRQQSMSPERILADLVSLIEADVHPHTARRLRVTFRALQLRLWRTLPSNDRDWVARVGGRHCPGLSTIRHRL